MRSDGGNLVNRSGWNGDEKVNHDVGYSNDGDDHSDDGADDNCNKHNDDDNDECDQIEEAC